MEYGKVSVIIPAYNREKCIEKCIRSICSQSYQDLEIIIVDDGSEDNTLGVCRQLQESDSRIHIIVNGWGGVSRARNSGLEYATGKYIQFVDADDSIKEFATEHLVRTMIDRKADLVISGYDKILSNMILRNNQLDKPGYYSSRDYLIQTLKDPGHHYFGAIWNKLYKRQVILEHHLVFDEEIDLGEDFIFNLHYLCSIHRVYVITERLYIYNCMEDNTLSRYEKNLEACKKELKNRHQIFEEYKKAFQCIGMYDQYESMILRYWLMYLILNIYYIRYEFQKMDREELREWKQILREDQDVSRSRYTVSQTYFKMLQMKVLLKNLLKKTAEKILDML